MNSSRNKVTIASSKRNAEINRQIEENIYYFRSEPRYIIKERIADLDKEWDIERTLELNASLLSLTGVVLSATVSKKWLWLPAIVVGFLVQHAIQGWSPPIALLRRMNIRTRKEIEKERHGLILVLKDNT